MLVAVKGEVALGLLVFVPGDAVGRGELGHHESASAEVADEAAEDGVGDAGHGRKHRGGTDFDSAERYGRGDANAFGRRGALGRIVEKLGHELILAGPKNKFTTETEATKVKSKSDHGFPRIGTDKAQAYKDNRATGERNA